MITKMNKSTTPASTTYRKKGTKQALYKLGLSTHTGMRAGQIYDHELWGYYYNNKLYKLVEK